MASTLRQNYTTGADVNAMIYGGRQCAMTFTVVDGHAVDQVDLYIAKVGAPTGVLTIAVYATSGSLPTGSALVSTTKNDLAYRHGFKRYKIKRSNNSFSQEDDKACAGSGKEVVYKRFKK